MIEIKTNLGVTNVSISGDSSTLCAEYISAVNSAYNVITEFDPDLKDVLKSFLTCEVMTGSIFEDHEDHV